MLNFLVGYKTYIIAFCGLIYGMYIQDHQTIITCLGMIGLRSAIK